MPATVLPELDVEKVRRWCKARVPARVADQVRLDVTVRGRRISIHECRPPFMGVGDWSATAVAQLRYEGDGLWTLYFGDRNGKWVEYYDLEPGQRIDVMIAELEDDPTCVFWG